MSASPDDAPSAPAVPGARRAAVIFIFVTLLIDILSFGVIIPVLPQLIKGFLGGDFARAAVWATVMSAVFSAIQFVFAPVQGALSDRYGRRPVILISNLGLGLDFAFMALVNSIPLLFIGRVISGITAASFSTANAYIADVTPPERRAKAFGMLGAAFGIGFIMGPALGGFLAEMSPRAPFWLSAGLAVANFCYGFFVLPESLPPERRSARFDWRHANPLGALLMLRRYPQVLGLATVFFLSQLAHYVLPSAFVLYADYRYHWGEQAVGFTLAGVGVCNLIVQAVLVGVLVPRLGERRMLLVGMVCGVAGFVAIGLATTGLASLASLPLLALWGLAGPATQALLTRKVGPSEQGRLQGAVTSLSSVGGIFGPLLFGAVFAASISTQARWHVPGAVFLLAAFMLVLAWMLAYVVTRERVDPAPPAPDTSASAAG